MVVDTSALLAILLQEPEAERIAKAIASDSRRLLSAFTALETGILVEARKGEPGGRELDLLLHRTQMDIVLFSASLSEVAREAWRRYGGSGHPANLNVGDCCSYALSKVSGEPLLFKGDDFSRTDVTAVAY